LGVVALCCRETRGALFHAATVVVEACDLLAGLLALGGLIDAVTEGVLLAGPGSELVRCDLVGERPAHRRVERNCVNGGAVR
jgi:hypothetical protein